MNEYRRFLHTSFKLKLSKGASPWRMLCSLSHYTDLPRSIVLIWAQSDDS